MIKADFYLKIIFLNIFFITSPSPKKKIISNLIKQALNFRLINCLKISLKTLTIHQSSPTRQITSVESLMISQMQFFLPH